MTEHVSVIEVGPRDGLQNEKKFIALEDKVKLVNLLSGCGFDAIEVTSFVSPKWVPQLADAAEVMQGIQRQKRTSYAVLVPNLKGYKLAKLAKANEVAIFAAASETFSHKNINCSIDESMARFSEIMSEACEDKTPVRGYISCVVDCPYEGAVDPGQVADVAKKLFQMGCYEVSLGDTTGQGTPETIAAMLDVVLDVVQPSQFAGHYHDTNHRALENIEVSLDKGLRRFDAAIAGLGGCPYAPGAKGNVSTSKVVQLVEQKNFSTGIDLEKLNDAERFARNLVYQNGTAQGKSGKNQGRP